ncbi:Transcriptional regulator, LysR family protein [Minicystis rosea]|nr:Transcriptional regulator, LysR family protein [Minicystis rosea]
MTAKTQDIEGARWDDVRVFLAVRRHGSFGAAGARLGMDTSTVSRRLAALEAALGAQLFERSREGVVPTRRAELVLPAAEAMEAAHGRFARDASALDSTAEGIVRVSVAPGMADSFVAPLLVRLRARYPKIGIELDASVRPLDLTRHEAEIALRSVRPQGADLVMTKILTSRWVAVASPERVKALGRMMNWEAEPWIAWDRDLASLPPARWLARHVPHADIALRTSHFASQLVAAREGLGIVLAPEPFARIHGLVPVSFASALAASAEAWPSDDLWLVGHRALRDVPRVAAVWSFLLDELALMGEAKRPRRSRAARSG